MSRLTLKFICETWFEWAKISENIAISVCCRIQCICAVTTAATLHCYNTHLKVATCIVSSGEFIEDIIKNFFDAKLNETKIIFLSTAKTTTEKQSI